MSVVCVSVFWCDFRRSFLPWVLLKSIDCFCNWKPRLVFKMSKQPPNFWSVVAAAHRGAANRRYVASSSAPNPAPILQQVAPAVPLSSAVAAASTGGGAASSRFIPKNGGRHHPPKVAPVGYKRKPTVSFEVGQLLDMEHAAFEAQITSVRNARRMRARGVGSKDVNVLARPGGLAPTVGGAGLPSVAEVTGQPDLVGQNPLQADPRTEAAAIESAETTSRAAVAPSTVAPSFANQGGFVAITTSRAPPGVQAASLAGEKQQQTSSSLFRSSR